MTTRLIFAVVCAALFFACVEQQASIVPRGAKTADQLPFRATLQVEKRGYAVGETVPMSVLIENPGPETVALVFPSRRRAAFEVSYVGRGKPTTLVVVRLDSDPEGWIKRVAPGRSWRLGGAWDGWGPEGSSPPLGRYAVRAVIFSEPPFVIGPVEIGLVD
jgi:hypothetical protein